MMEAIRGILGSPVAAGAPLMSAGLDSLGAVELLKELTRQASHTPISSSLVNSCPTSVLMSS